MLRLWTLILGPPGLIFLGASITAVGGFWAASRQSSSSIEQKSANLEVKLLNEKILELQQESLANVRGADLCFVLASQNPNSNGSFNLNIIVPGDLPVFDVYLRIIKNVDTPIDTPAQLRTSIDNMSNPIVVEVGNVISRGVKNLDVTLSPGYHQIDIRTRNAKYTETLKFGLFGSTLGQSIIIKDGQGNVLHKLTSPENYPSIN